MSFFFDPLERGAYDLVKIDVSWPWETYSEKGAKKSPSAHYKPMPWDEIEALPVRELLRPGGVVFAYCTWPLIGRQHLTIDRCWGLDVKTGGAWAKMTVNDKRRLGPGHIIRSVCEPFLIACDKRHRLKARGKAWNFIEACRDAEFAGLAREHSRKPEEVYRHLEEQTPGWRRADVFARQRRDGWEGFGWELDKFK